MVALVNPVTVIEPAPLCGESTVTKPGFEIAV